MAPLFRVPKVQPDPKVMVFTYLWDIWGHLDALKQQYLVKTTICQKPDLVAKTLQLPQPTWSNFWGEVRTFHLSNKVVI